MRTEATSVMRSHFPLLRGSARCRALPRATSNGPHQVSPSADATPNHQPGWSRRFRSTSPWLSGRSGEKKGGLGPFVSEHYEQPAGAVVDFLERQGSEWKRASQGWLNLKVCPDAVCNGSHSQQASKGDAGNHGTFGVHEKSGAFHCFRCDAKGNWYTLKQRMTGIEAPVVSVSHVAQGGAEPPTLPSSAVSYRQGVATADAGGLGEEHEVSKTELQKQPPHGELFLQYAGALRSCQPAIDFLVGQRLIRQDVLEKFRVGVALYTFKGRQLTSVTFPWFTKESELPVRVKVRAIEDKKFMRLDPVGGPWGFFGWPSVRADSESVVLTEGELDALSVYQETGMAAVSLPNGARSFPPDLLEQLEQFKTVYVWCDDDVPGREGAEMCVKKLGRHRCRVVRSRRGASEGPKDANEVLQLLSKLRSKHAQELALLDARVAGVAGVAASAAEEQRALAEERRTLREQHAEAEAALDMSKMLAEAAEVQHEHVISFKNLRDQVKLEFQEEAGHRGTSFGSSLPGLDRILKGHRSGELTIFTGRTGQGKTSVCSQLSLDLCEQGVHTLWGSFEIKNVRLAAKMIQQHSRVSLRNSSQLFEEAADSFTALPLWFLSYYGSTDVDEVLDAMEYAVYVHDVRHVVIDNLQFMTSREGGGGADIFRVLDNTVHKIRKFASMFNVHVTLVIHPRKDDESHLLTLASIFGSAKATQESDNVIILQNNGVVKYLDVRKNRFDGELGFVPFEFNKKNQRFRELSSEEVEALTEQSKDTGSSW